MYARKALLAISVAAVALSASAAQSEDRPVEQTTDLSVPAPRIDNALGELPPFRTWTDPWVYSMPAESLDSGLGDLPPYSEWRYAWVYAMPGEKVDSGLGELSPYSEWRYPWVYAMPAEKIDSGLGDSRPIAVSTGPHATKD